MPRESIVSLQQMDHVERVKRLGFSANDGTARISPIPIPPGCGILCIIQIKPSQIVKEKEVWCDVYTNDGQWSTAF